MIFARPAEAPFYGGSGIINKYFKEALEELDFQVDAIHHDVHNDKPRAEQLIPLATVSALHRSAVAPRPAVTFYDDFGLTLRAPVRVPQHRAVLFFHVLRGAGIAIANPNVDRYWCNSDYLAAVLRSFMTFPDWTRATVLDSRGAAATRSVRLPLPLLDFPDGYPSEGDRLPRAAAEAGEKGNLIGHCVHWDKSCPDAILHLMRAINEDGDHRGGGAVNLVVNEALIPPLTRRIDQLPPASRKQARSWFISVPWLANAALVELMKRADFGLSFNRTPEAFGVYPLESVLLDCPVYTNGSGNYRSLLPPGHGITVLETERTAFGDPADYASIGNFILEAVTSGAGAAECQLGKELIREQHSRDAFTEDIREGIAHLDRDLDGVELAHLELELSPLVRSWNPYTGRVVSDHRNLQLTPTAADLLGSCLGTSALDLPTDDSAREQLVELFYRGVVSLAPRSD